VDHDPNPAARRSALPRSAPGEPPTGIFVPGYTAPGTETPIDLVNASDGGQGGTPGGLARAGRGAWSLVGIGAVMVAAGWLLWRLRVVVFPLFVAVLVASVLRPLHRGLLRRGVRPGISAAIVVVGLIAGLAGIGLIVIPAVAGQLGELGTQVGAALDRLERWVARERPFGLDASDLSRFRSDVVSASPDTDAIANGARTAGSVLAGLLFTVIATFFFLKDGHTMVERTVQLMPVGWRDDAWAIARSIVSSLAGYARGAAVLGGVEGTVIGIAIALVGGDLAIVIALLTFLGAFVPFVGAIVAGLLAVAVTLVTAGTTPALVVAAVALVVQQLDNDFLAPLIYGRFLQIHPLAVLASISVGIETAGLIGAFVAVPIAASAVSIWRVIAQRHVRQILGIAPATRRREVHE